MQAPYLHRHDHFIQSSTDQSILLRMREASPTSTPMNIRGPHAILCIHGAVTPSIIFDIPFPKMSWLNFFASAGTPTFALDLRGYGRSTKPMGMTLPIDKAPFDCDHRQSLQDTHDAVTFIQTHLGVEKISLFGLSWGSLLAGMYASQYPNNVHSLVLLGPVYSYKNPLWAPWMDSNNEEHLHPAITGYRVIERSMLSPMWSYEIPKGQQTLWQDEAVVQHIEAELLQSDLEWSKANIPNSFRAPNGVLQDVAKIYNGHEFYRPEDIDAPTLILRGDHDQSSHPKDMEGLFRRLSSPQKYYYTLGNGSHYALIERKSPFMMELALHFLRAI